MQCENLAFWNDREKIEINIWFVEIITIGILYWVWNFWNRNKKIWFTSFNRLLWFWKIKTYNDQYLRWSISRMIKILNDQVGNDQDFGQSGSQMINISNDWDLRSLRIKTLDDWVLRWSRLWMIKTLDVQDTLQPHYNTVVYNTNSVITRLRLGSHCLLLLCKRPSL